MKFKKKVYVGLSVDIIHEGHINILKTASKYGLQVSGATKLTDGTCPAWKQGGECKECRNCWNKSVFNVVYKAH